MDSFISHIINDISADQLTQLKDRAYVFPTRRACYYFREALMEAYPTQTFWSPQILSIEDFVAVSAGHAVTDDLQLMFELYQVYTETYLPHPEGSVKKEELPTFDLFYAWGQILLSDFDEVDRYLVDADKLYGNLQDLKDLENLYADNEEVLFALQRFNEMLGQQQTDLMANFSNQWTRVCKTYHAFKARLQKKGLRYSGQVYREVAEQLEDGSLILPYQQVVFAGFNALSTSEEIIFDTLMKKGTGCCYWDADCWYLENEGDEAGKFLRQYYRKWKPSATSKWVISDLLKEDKHLHLQGGVQSLGQAQITGQLLKDIPEKEQRHTAVVLSDENLLYPALYALPESISKLNVTMGSPLKQSQWFRLIQAYLHFQLQIRGRGEKVYFNVEALRALLSISLMQGAAYARIWHILNDLRGSRSRWILAQTLLSSEIPAVLRLALTPQDRTKDLMKKLGELLVTLYHRLRLEEDPASIESEYAYHCIKHLKQLEQQLAGFNQQIELRTMVSLVSEAFQGAKVPFSGEPIGGVQVMGFLETRTLDFERVFILSANEGKLPKGIQHKSYIPFALRKTFKLPTFEEQDAIYSYHFKRILQRAKHIHILYNTEVAIDGSGEKSRFLWQLQQAFNKDAIQEQIFQMPLTGAPVDQQLTIEKTEEVLARLHEIYTKPGGEQKSLSPTAIRHYLDCTLRFYFRYLLRLPERRPVKTELDAADFGNVVHYALDRIYSGTVNQVLSQAQLQEMRASELVADSVKSAFQEFYRRSTPALLEGKDVLHELIVQKLLYKVLSNDFSEAPFTVVATEEKVTHSIEVQPGLKLNLEGTLDRVHQKDGTIGIIDYKTGRADVVRTWEPQFPLKAHDYLARHFEQPRYKSGFQGFFYAYLWHQIYPDKPVRIGVYPLKKVNDGIQWLNHGAPLPVDAISMFEDRLKEVLQSIFDPEISFEQTEDHDRCRFCAYKEICQR